MKSRDWYDIINMFYVLSECVSYTVGSLHKFPNPQKKKKKKKKKETVEKEGE